MLLPWKPYTPLNVITPVNIHFITVGRAKVGLFNKTEMCVEQLLIGCGKFVIYNTRIALHG